MKKSVKSLVAFALLSVCVFTGCNSQSETEYKASDELFVAVADSKIERFDSVELELGKNVKDVTWSSSDSSIAVVEDGELIGLKAGTAVISAVKGNEKQEQKISVVDNGKTPTINVDYFPVMRGSEYKLDTKAYFNGLQLDNTTFTYSVADTSVAKLVNNVLTGVSCGETTVTISLSWRNQNVLTKTVPCEVMKNVAVYTDKAEYTLYTMGSVLGETFETEMQIQPTVYYDNAKIDGAAMTWVSGDESIATVDANGKVEAVSYGETYVVGTCEHNGETLSTRKVPVKIEKPCVKTGKTLPVKVGNANVTVETILGSEYSFGKAVNLSTGYEYDYTENGTDLSSFGAGEEYTFVFWEETDAFSAELDVLFADYVVTDQKTLLEATSALNAYVVLANDIEVALPKPPEGDKDYRSGTFNGLGHTITVTSASSKRGLYVDIDDFVFKDLSIVFRVTGVNCGALAYRAFGDIVIDNCYFETTIANEAAKNIGGLVDYFQTGMSLTMTNSIVKVSGLNLNETIQTTCGAIISRCKSKKVFLVNSYVIADGTLCATYDEVNNKGTKQVNSLRVIYKDEQEFAKAKEKNKIVLDDYNQYWDLTGIIPKFK